MTIQALLLVPLSCRAIARQLKQHHHSTICREIKRGKPDASDAPTTYQAGVAAVRAGRNRTSGAAARRKLGPRHLYAALAHGFARPALQLVARASRCHTAPHESAYCCCAACAPCSGPSPWTAALDLACHTTRTSGGWRVHRTPHSTIHRTRHRTRHGLPRDHLLRHLRHASGHTSGSCQASCRIRLSIQATFWSASGSLV